MMNALLKESEIKRELHKGQTQESGPPPPASWRLSHEMVARRAFEIWKRHGCPSGTAFQDWLAAETELRSRR